MQQTQIPLHEDQLESVTPEVSSQGIAITIVVPVMNEELNVRPLFEKLSAQLLKLEKNY
jgi:hypothetical protein